MCEDIEGTDVDGYVIDEKKARESPCICYKITIGNKTFELCWSKGIVGVLSKEQIKKYCPKKIYKKPSEKMLKRYEIFAKVARETSGIPLSERLRIISELLKKKE